MVRDYLMVARVRRSLTDRWLLPFLFSWGLFDGLRWPSETMVSWFTTSAVLSVFTKSSFWKRKISNGHRPSDRTYVEILDNFTEAQPPSGNFLAIFPRAEIPN